MRVWPVVVLLACSSKSDEPAKVEPKATPVAKAVDNAKPMPPEPVEKAKPPAAPAKPAPPAEPTDKDKAQLAKYRAAMTRGRKLTDAKKYDDAIAAFDEAEQAKKGDARAIAERGYARLLAGQLLGATQEFDEAAGATKDSRLLSQIWFNRGLVDEKRNQADNALVDFYLANKLRPSEAAKNKLGGKKVCPVIVTRRDHFDPPAKDDPLPALVDAPDWLALASKMPMMPGDYGDAPPKTAVDARRAFGVEEPKLPTMALDGQSGMGRYLYLVVARASGLRAILFAIDGGGRCPGSVSGSIVAVRGSVVHVHGSDTFEGGMTEVCPDSKDGECTGAPGEHYTEACMGGTPQTDDLIVDTESGKSVSITRPELADGAEEVTVKLDDAGIHLGGLDCDSVIPW